MQFIQRMVALFRSSGPLVPGRGQVSGILALALALLSLLAVLAFHFPEYLTTPELRRAYPVAGLRHALLGALLVAGGLALANLVLGRARTINAAALAAVALATALGGNRVPVGDFPDGTPYLGLDWFILDLLASTLVFVLIEKLVPLRREQPVFRRGWQTDLAHFAVNHLLIGVTLLAVNLAVHGVLDGGADGPLQEAVRGLPFALELFLILLVADLIQYGVHRAYHEVPLLWRFHAVHHSAPVMDWIAGSRMHVLEVLVSRVAVLAPLYALGFSKGVMDAYVVVVGFQTVLNHANVKLPWGPLKHVLVTPDFHHWHHSSERAALDRNYAAHFSFLDRIFGTAVEDPRPFPSRYGVLDGDMPEGFWGQQRFPFRHRGR